MTFLYLLGLLLLVATVFWWWQGSSALSSLERGDHGPFKVSRVSGARDSYLALDAESKKLALVNNGVPEFNASEELVGYRNTTVVFSFADVSTVRVTRDETTAMVDFFFVRPIPPWNVRKHLSYVSGEAIRTFFENYVPELKVTYFTKNKYGGVDPW